jgi:hypothetical protein
VADARRRREESRRSGVVLAVGICEIVLAALYLFCGVIGGLGGLCCASGAPLIEQILKQQARQDPNAAEAAKKLGDGQIQTTAWVAVAEAIINIVLGFVMLAAGIGVIRRANWARIVTIGVAAMALMLEVIVLVFRAVFVFGALNQVVVTPGDFVAQIATLLIVLAFAGFAGIVLLLPRYSREFA